MVQINKAFKVRFKQGASKNGLTPGQEYIVVGSDQHGVKWTVVDNNKNFTNIDVNLCEFVEFLPDTTEQFIESVVEKVASKYFGPKTDVETTPTKVPWNKGMKK